MAVKLFEAFEDERAAAALRQLLKRAPPGNVVSKAHLYLGLIAFNHFDPDEARIEFRRALEANPANNLPPQASPKARLAFAQVRRDVEAEVETGSRAPNEGTALMPAFESVPATGTTSPQEVEQTAPAHPRVAAYLLGAATLVLAGLAVYGGVEVLNFNSTVNAANSAATGTKPTYSNDARGPASFWAVGWPLAAGLGAAGVVGTVLTW